MSDKLSQDYIYELIACCIKSKKVLEICHSHLKYEFLETDSQKRVVKYLFDTYTLTNLPPTFGQIAQSFNTNQEVLNFLAKVKKIKIKEGTENSVLTTFETYIKDMKFQSLYHKAAKLFNEGKTDECYSTMNKESAEIVDFSIKAKRYVEVFTQFDDRMIERERDSQQESKKIQRCATGIHEMDHLLRGGFDYGSSFLGMARSGVGKTTYLRWCALCNARMGKVVILFQGESTEKKAMKAIDAAWTSITMDELEIANVPSHMVDKVKAVKREILSRGGRIYVVPDESFSKMTIEESNDVIEEIKKIEGRVDLVLWDYLEIYNTKGQWSKGESAERRRREDIAEKITRIATIHNCVTGSMTQSQDIKMELVNNPDFNMTSNHASEFKGVIKPFSYFFTLNATKEEYDTQWLRVYLDKVRDHPAGKVIKIIQARDIGRFYNAIETKKTFYDYNAVNIR